MTALAWELLGAVVGAGLASGREIASFFAQYGAWCVSGIALAMLTLCFLADAAPTGRLWQALLTALLIATGGAMLSGAGHVAALTLSVRHAEWIGTAFTLFLAVFLAKRTSAGLSWVSRLMLLAMLVMILLGFTAQPMRAVHLVPHSPVEALLRGVTYGGFNAALMLPLLAGSSLQGRSRRHAIGLGCLFVALLIALGCAVLLRHPALISQSMPFVALMAQFGKSGYYLSALCLYLAILSTLIVCIRGAGSVGGMAGMLLISLLGFDGAVNLLYPVLGGACFLMLAGTKIGKITKSLR